MAWPPSGHSCLLSEAPAQGAGLPAKSLCAPRAGMWLLWQDSSIFKGWGTSQVQGGGTARLRELGSTAFLEDTGPLSPSWRLLWIFQSLCIQGLIDWSQPLTHLSLIPPPSWLPCCHSPKQVSLISSPSPSHRQLWSCTPAGRSFYLFLSSVQGPCCPRRTHLPTKPSLAGRGTLPSSGLPLPAASWYTTDGP